MTMTYCQIPPAGWQCSRKAGHDGPCAAERKPVPQYGSQPRPQGGQGLAFEPLDNFGPFSSFLSPAAQRLYATPGTGTIHEQFRVLPDGPWEDGPPRRLFPVDTLLTKRVLLATYMGYVVTGPIRRHHLRHFAAKINAARRLGYIEHGCLVQAVAMPLASGRVMVGLHTYEERPVRHALLFYPYTALGYQEQKALLWPMGCNFDEGGMPPDFPEHLFTGEAEEAPDAPAPAGYWADVLLRAAGVALMAAGVLRAGWQVMAALTE